MDAGFRRPDLARLRESLEPLRLIVAEVDGDLRYVWIDNPHPDFDPSAVVGKRDDDLLPAKEAAPIMALKRHVLTAGSSLNSVIAFRRSDGNRKYSIAAYPIIDDQGDVDGVLTIGFETLM